MAKKMLKDEDLSVILAKAISSSENLTDGKLSKECEEVERYYRGELPAPLHKGDSKYVSRDVFDSVDSMRATVLEAFSANTRIVYFRPEKGETVAGAKQATDYCRHVFFKENEGETVLYETLTDGLKNRFSVVKVYFEESEDDQDYDFENLTPEELTLELEKYKEWDIKESFVDDDNLYSGTFTVTTRKKNICTEVIQREDLLVSNNAPSLTKAKYAIHRTSKTRSYLAKAYGKEKAEKLNFQEAAGRYAFDYEKQARFEPVGHMIGSGEAHDAANEETTLYEIYINIDMEKKGTTSLWKVMFSCGEVLHKERVSRMPFASFIPLPVPHTFFGENYAKAVIPMQNARTVLIRQIINHSLVTNNPRQQVLNGTLLNPNELLENRLGGVVNVRRMDGIAPIPQAQLNPFIFNLIQMINEDKEEVTGISKLSQGMNKDAVSSQNSQGMVEQLISASQQRTKIISRRFGIFVKELWQLIYATAVDHMDEAEYIDATGNYVPVTPHEWKERTAASVELTLGYGDQDKEAQKWIEVDAAFSQDPQLKPLYTLDRRYNVISRAMEAKGIEDIASVLLPPEEMPPQEPDPMMLLEMELKKSQIDYQKAQTEAMRGKIESDGIRAQADLIRAQTEAKFKGSETNLETARLANDAFVDREELKLASKAAEQKAVYNPG